MHIGGSEISYICLPKGIFIDRGAWEEREGPPLRFNGGMAVIRKEEMVGMGTFLGAIHSYPAFPARFWLGRLPVLAGARGQGAGGEGLWGTGWKEEEETVRLQGNSPLAPLLHGDLTFLDATMRRNVVVRLPGRRGAGVLPAPLSLVSKAAQSSR